jgi:hypothetical protein
MRWRGVWVVAWSVAGSACLAQHTAGGDGGLPADLQACDGNEQCVVVPESCCGTCGAATPGDAIGVNVTQAGAYRALACEGHAGCPACYVDQDPTLVGTCAAGRCAVVDLEEHAVTACAADEDCRLRTRDCCECGGDATVTGLIAIRADAEAAYVALVCNADTACAECAPIYPDEASAVCTSAGHCAVQWSDP